MSAAAFPPPPIHTATPPSTQRLLPTLMEEVNAKALVTYPPTFDATPATTRMSRPIWITFGKTLP